MEWLDIKFRMTSLTTCFRSKMIQVSRSPPEVSSEILAKCDSRKEGNLLSELPWTAKLCHSEEFVLPSADWPSMAMGSSPKENSPTNCCTLAFDCQVLSPLNPWSHRSSDSLPLPKGAAQIRSDAAIMYSSTRQVLMWHGGFERGTKKIFGTGQVAVMFNGKLMVLVLGDPRSPEAPFFDVTVAPSPDHCWASLESWLLQSSPASVGCLWFTCNTFHLCSATPSHQSVLQDHEIHCDVLMHFASTSATPLCFCSSSLNACMICSASARKPLRPTARAKREMHSKHFPSSWRSLPTNWHGSFA